MFCLPLCLPYNLCSALGILLSIFGPTFTKYLLNRSTISVGPDSVFPLSFNNFMAFQDDLLIFAMDLIPFHMEEALVLFVSKYL